MEHLWGISGPQFLVMYCVGLVLALAWALWSRYRVRRPEAPALGQRLGVAELAFLAGGPRRVVEVAIARLVETGQIHVARNGLLTAANTANDDDRVQEAVLGQVVGRRPSTAWSVMRNVSDGAAVRAVGDRLVEQRLLVAPAQAAAARRRAVLGFYVVGAIGVLRFVEGLRLGRPVGYLFVLLLLTVAVVILLLRRGIKARTVHGDQALASARGMDVHEPDHGPHPAVALAGAGAAVALGGLAAFPDAAMRNALMPDAPTNTMTSSWTGVQSWAYASNEGYLSHSPSSGGHRGSSGGGSSCGGGGSSCGGGGSSSGGGDSSSGGGGSGCGGCGSSS